LTAGRTSSKPATSSSTTLSSATTIIVCDTALYLSAATKG
jgi:hypothetical protein